MKREPLFVIENMSKSFGPTKALKNVSMKFYRGEIRGIIGENGSGKSTISSIISGMQKADSGEMLYKGKNYNPESMLDAMEQGISMIVQEAGTILNISVADNIYLGKENRFHKNGFINRRRMNEAAGKILASIGISDIDPGASINSLNYEDRKLVEIARVMVDRPEILIVDETTTALSQNGRELLYKLIRVLRSEGVCVLFISHDLEELMETCDELTVLRDGELIQNVTKEDMEEDLIKELMVGHKIEGDYYRPDQECSHSDRVAVRVKNVTVGKSLTDFSLELHEGEILGIGGLSGSGMHELGRAMFGVEKVLLGEVVVEKTNQRITSSSKAIKNSIGYVSKNRDIESLILRANIRDNIMLPCYDKVKTLGLLSKRKIAKFVGNLIDTLSIKCASQVQEVRYLSGGNKQKISFSKWIGADSDILILDGPTRGIDIGVKASMYQLMMKFKQEGKSILMISEELPELIGMCDRIMILKDGHLTKTFVRDENPTESQIIKEMI